MAEKLWFNVTCNMFNSRYIIPLHDLAKYLFVAMWKQSRKLSHIIVLLNVKGFIMLNT